MKKLLTGLLFVVLSAASASAACTPSAGQATCNTITNGDTGGATRATLNLVLGQVFNVQEFKAVGDGSADDTVPIQNAIAAACAAGSASIQFGGVVYFPPGNYKTISPITMCSGNGSLSIVGAGRHSTRITGNYAGYVLDKPDNGLQNLERIQDIGVYNSRQNADAGAIRCNNCQQAVLVGLDISGFTGLEMASNSYGAAIYDSHVGTPTVAGFPGTMGMYLASASAYNVRMEGWDTCYALSNSSLILSGNQCETSNLAVNVGLERPNVFTGVIDGSSNLTVSGFVATQSPGQGIVLGSGLRGAGITPGSTVIASQTSGTTGGNGVYVLTGSPGAISSEQMTTVRSPGAQGWKITGFESERLNIGVLLQTSSDGSIDSSVFTGSVGVPVHVTTATWSGGTATLTTSYPHGQSGSQDCTVENISPSGYNVNHATCNYNSTTTVTYTISNPGGSGSGADASVSPLQANGLFACNAGNVTISNTSFNMAIKSGSFDIDLQCGGFFSGSYITFQNVSASSWNMPTSVVRSGFAYINSNNPSAAMQFADLPGQSGVTLTTPITGMQYDLTNCTIGSGGAWGGAVTNGGGGGVACRVYYNGSGWTAIGK